jgi:hypothetical protein
MKPQKRQPPRRRADRFAALSRLGTALMRHMDEKTVFHVSAQAARELTGAAFAAVIVRPEPEEQEEGEPLVPI